MDQVQRSGYSRQAAVLIAVDDSKGRHNEEVLLTLRAAHLKDHSGEVAFPGGKWEPGDEDLKATALRESYEEVGLPESEVEIVGELSSSYTRQGTKVTPYVGKVRADMPLKANPDELSALFWFPVRIVMEDQRVRTDIFELMGKEYWAPVYKFQDFTVWGFTARVLAQFIEGFYGVGISREHTAPEIKFRSKK